jgi:hypothetical protein
MKCDFINRLSLFAMVSIILFSYSCGTETKKEKKDDKKRAMKKRS